MCVSLRNVEKDLFINLVGMKIPDFSFVKVGLIFFIKRVNHWQKLAFSKVKNYWNQQFMFSTIFFLGVGKALVSCGKTWLSLIGRNFQRYLMISSHEVKRWYSSKGAQNFLIFLESLKLKKYLTYLYQNYPLKNLWFWWKKVQITIFLEFKKILSSWETKDYGKLISE
jgi:hypothetical protein